MDIFTLFHVSVSLLALIIGIDVLLGLIKDRNRDFATPLFLFFAVTASLTGFGFPFVRFLPSHAVAVLSLVSLGFAMWSRYVVRQTKLWRTVFAFCITLSVYFLAFVAIAQAFLKFSILNSISPTQQDPPFIIAQSILLLIFAFATNFAVRSARRGPFPDEGVLSH